MDVAVEKFLFIRIKLRPFEIIRFYSMPFDGGYANGMYGFIRSHHLKNGNFYQNWLLNIRTATTSKTISTSHRRPAFFPIIILKIPSITAATTRNAKDMM